MGLRMGVCLRIAQTGVTTSAHWFFPGKTPKPPKLWELWKTLRAFCFLRRVFQALWKLVEKSLMDDLLPLDDFSTVSIARQFPQLSPRERYLAPVSVLPFINSRPASPSFLRPSQAVIGWN
jgi:hypothetical protein